MTQPNLRHKLVLEAPSRVSDTGGGVTLIWTELGTVWADITPKSATERLSGERLSSRVTHRITIRSAPEDSPRRPTPECRFRRGARIFSILGIAEHDQRGAYLTCWAEEGPFT